MANRFQRPEDVGVYLQLQEGGRFAERSTALSVDWTWNLWDEVGEYVRTPMTLVAMHEWFSTQGAIDTIEDVALLFRVASQNFDYNVTGAVPDLPENQVNQLMTNAKYHLLICTTAQVFLRNWSRQLSSTESGLNKVHRVLGLPVVRTMKVAGPNMGDNIRTFPTRKPWLKAAIGTGLTDREDVQAAIRFSFLFHTQYSELTLCKLLFSLADKLQVSYNRLAELLDIGEFGVKIRGIFARAVGGRDPVAPPIPGFPWCRMFNPSAHLNYSVANNRNLVSTLLAANLQAEGILDVPRLASGMINMNTDYWRRGLGIGNLNNVAPAEVGPHVPAPMEVPGMRLARVNVAEEEEEEM